MLLLLQDPFANNNVPHLQNDHSMPAFLLTYNDWPLCAYVFVCSLFTLIWHSRHCCASWSTNLYLIKEELAGFRKDSWIL